MVRKTVNGREKADRRLSSGLLAFPSKVCYLFGGKFATLRVEFQLRIREVLSDFFLFVPSRETEFMV